jgi:transcriptional regulator with XRE-family HTH domain
MRQTMLAKAIAREGLTLAEVARRVTDHTRGWDGPTLEPTDTQVSEWRRGKVRPGNEYIAALAAVLSLDEERLRADFNWHATNQRKRRIMGEQGDMSIAQIGAARSDMRRRHLLQLGGVVIGAGVTDGLVPPADREPLRLLRAAGQSSIGAGVLDTMESLTDHYARHFWHYPTVDLDQRLTEQVVEVGTLLEGRATIAEKTRLCWIGARMASLLGFLRWSLGRVDDAEMWHQAAFTLAEQAGDREAMAYVLSRESTVAYFAGRHIEAADLAAFGQQIVVSGRLQADLASNEARAAARVGNADAARAAVLITRQLIDDGEVTSTEDRFSFTPAEGLLKVASTELELGNLAATKALAEASIEASTTHRDRISNMPYAQMILAAAELRLGNLDTAIGEATAVITAPQRDAYGLLVHARELLADLAPHADSPLVRDYRERLDGFSRKALPN